MRLVQALHPLGSDGTLHAFQLLSSLLPLIEVSQVSYDDPFGIHVSASDWACRALHGVVHGDGPPGAFTLARKAHTSATLERCIEDLVWAAPTFWNFVAARRVLWATVLTLHCPNSLDCDEHALWYRMCPRKRALSVLAPLQRRALGEVKVKVHLVADSKLPVELVEAVVEAALRAEEVPVNASIWEATMYPQPDIMSECWQTQHPFRSVGLWKLKCIYRCETYRPHSETPALEMSASSCERRAVLCKHRNSVLPDYSRS